MNDQPDNAIADQPSGADVGCGLLLGFLFGALVGCLVGAFWAIAEDSSARFVLWVGVAAALFGAVGVALAGLLEIAIHAFVRIFRLLISRKKGQGSLDHGPDGGP